MKRCKFCNAVLAIILTAEVCVHCQENPGLGLADYKPPEIADEIHFDEPNGSVLEATPPGISQVASPPLSALPPGGSTFPTMWPHWEQYNAPSIYNFQMRSFNAAFVSSTEEKPITQPASS